MDASGTGVNGWRKSSACPSETCIEVQVDLEVVRIRNSMHPKEGVLEFSAAEWQVFVVGVQRGEFDIT